MNDDLPTVIGAAFSDALTALKFDAPGLAGTGIGLLLSRMLRERIEEGRKIFLEEISHASRPIRDVQRRMSSLRSRIGTYRSRARVPRASTWVSWPR